MGLIQYITTRVAAYLVILFIGITITFFLPRFMPSDPIEGYINQIQTMAGQSMDPEAITKLRESLRKLYGLEGNLITQYFNYLKRVFIDFDFGPSLSGFP
jgi:peptide/nickel transport system permease protein